MTTYRLIRSAPGWPNKDYTLSEIQSRARRGRLTIRDGYGRTRIRSARKLVLTGGIQFRAVDEPEQPARAFGPRTLPA